MSRWRIRREWRQVLAYGAGLIVVLSGVVLLYGRGIDVARLGLPSLDLSVDLGILPEAALSSLGRMVVAYLLAVLFSLGVAYVAVSSRRAERVIVPLLDLLQSVPVLGFFPVAVYLFIQMTPGSELGVELASIFLIFTAQAWNIAFGIYEAWSTLPAGPVEASQAYGIRGWLRFRTLLWPACVPKLVYNSIASWSAGWYFLIACEIIAMGPLNYELIGLGSYLAHAAEQGDPGLLMAGLAVLIAIVVLMEFFLWRPLSLWTTKFYHDRRHPAEPGQLDMGETNQN